MQDVSLYIQRPSHLARQGPVDFFKTEMNSPPPKSKLQLRMRTNVPENEKRKYMLLVRVSKDEKLRIKSLTKSGGYSCMSDFIRNRIFRRLDKKNDKS